MPLGQLRSIIHTILLSIGSITLFTGLLLVGGNTNQIVIFLHGLFLYPTLFFALSDIVVTILFHLFGTHKGGTPPFVPTIIFGAGLLFFILSFIFLLLP